MTLPIKPGKSRFYYASDFREVISPSYVQKRPNNLVLEYRKEWSRAQDATTPEPASRWHVMCDALPTDRAYAQAYGRLVDNLGEPAGLGITAVQWQQSADMIGKRADQLVDLANGIRARSPARVARTLSVSRDEVRKIFARRYGVQKEFSNLWLELWFGWKPLVQDIYTALEVFSREVPVERIRGSATLKYPTGQSPAGEYPFCYEGIFANARVKVSLGVTVKISNPNIRLLQQFGLLNPFEIAFDGIPWSFVLGWFSNVGQVLSSVTDFAGLDILEGYRSETKELEGRTYWTCPEASGGWGKAYIYARSPVSALPRPPFLLKPINWSPTRGLTAISLLNQKLPRS